MPSSSALTRSPKRTSSGRSRRSLAFAVVALVFVIALAGGLVFHKPAQPIAGSPVDFAAAAHTATVAEHWDELETIGAEWTQQEPQAAAAWLAFAEAAHHRGDVEGVVEQLSNSPADAIDDCRFWVFKGWIHDQRNEATDAEAAFRQALLLNSYDWRARQNLAGVLRRTERLDEAARQATLADEGTILTGRLTQLANPRAADAELLARLATYALACGDVEVAEALRFRLLTADISTGNPQATPDVP